MYSLEFPVGLEPPNVVIYIILQFLLDGGIAFENMRKPWLSVGKRYSQIEIIEYQHYVLRGGPFLYLGRYSPVPRSGILPYSRMHLRWVYLLVFLRFDGDNVVALQFENSKNAESNWRVFYTEKQKYVEPVVYTDDRSYLEALVGRKKKE